jgi:hypothetical protein
VLYEHAKHLPSTRALTDAELEMRIKAIRQPEPPGLDRQR